MFSVPLPDCLLDQQSKPEGNAAMETALNPAPGFQRNPDHRITIEPFDGTVVVTFAEAIIASSNQAKVLREALYAPVYYIPLEDIYFEFLTRTETHTHCPYKGDASYWRVSAAGEALQDVMWAYEAPYDEMIAIRGHAAFYPEKVRIEVTPTPGAGF
jgi:uncharacterized protein (DUF427 family)